MKIRQNNIGPGNPTYIIAELSGNHNQNYDTAVKLVYAAHEAGANAVKLQTYLADTITIDSDKEYFKISGGTLWDGQTLHELYSKAYTPWEWHEPLMKLANELGMDLFSSPFDLTSIEYLEKLEWSAYKIASCEITDHILIKRIAETRKPVIISSGMASQIELTEAITLLKKYGTPEDQICLLKCTSAYPTKLEDANLKTLSDMMSHFNILGGLSDHTLGSQVSVVATALGASIIEKHFTLDRESGSPDDAFSLTPLEFKEMVQKVRETELILGSIQYGTDSEHQTKKHRRSLFIVQNIKKGDILTSENLKSIRPGDGLHTKFWWDLLGKKVNKDLDKGTPMDWEYVDL